MLITIVVFHLKCSLPAFVDTQVVIWNNPLNEIPMIDQLRERPKMTTSILRDSASYLASLCNQSLPARVGSRQDDSKRVEGGSNLVINLMLRLVNETFLALPVVECRNVTRTYEAHADNAQEPSLKHKHIYDACFIEWTRAKILSHPMGADSHRGSNRTDQTASKSLFESEIIDKNNLINQASKSILSLEVDYSSTNNRSANDCNPVDYSLVNLTYVSISSLLSICGVLINLFIIMIIVFRTNQRRSSLVRNCNPGHNNLLLFQLTITGLLFASYVLFDSIKIKNGFEHIRTPPTSNVFELNNGRRIGNLISDVFSHTSSPLSTFLPPIPIDPDRLLCTETDKTNVSRQKPIRIDTLNESGKLTHDILNLKEESAQRNDPALILMFKKKSLEHSSYQAKGLLYISYRQNEVSRFIDLSDSVETIFVAHSNCQLWDDSSGDTQRLSPDQQEPEFNEAINYSSMHLHAGYNYFKSLAPRSLPMFINVIVSVHIWTVAVLAYDRYCAIAHPLQYLRSLHAARTRTFFIVSWSASILFNLLLPGLLGQINPFTQYPYGVSMASGSYFESERATRLESDARETLIANGNFVHPDDDHRNGAARCIFTVPYSSSSELNFNDIASHPNRHSTQLDDDPGDSKETNEKLDDEFQDETRGVSHSSMVKLLAVLVDMIARSNWQNDGSESLIDTTRNVGMNWDGRVYIALQLAYSLLSFVIIVLVPLIVITICNISIYRIVKVHERRLSISSGSNIATSASNLQNNRHQLRGANSDEKSDIGSVTSLLLAKLAKFGFARSNSRQNISTLNEDGGVAQNCSSTRHCDCDRINGIDCDGKNGRNPDVIYDRPKRLMNRDESFRFVTKLNDENRTSSPLSERHVVRNKESNKQSQYGHNIIANCGSPSLNSYRVRRCRVKRKISDNKQDLTRRRGSAVSQADDRFSPQRELDAYHGSSSEYPSMSAFEHIRYDSGSIINQLKMAGLSFAGVAIQELSSGVHQRPLKKSSSCSLGNLTTSTHHSNQNVSYLHESAASRSSVETSGAISYAKKSSYLSLNTSIKHLDSYNPTKYSTKLLDGASYYSPPLSSAPIMYSHSQNRLPFTIGTKSAAFNVVIWLILTMLIFTLPHYLLITIAQIIRLNSPSNSNQYLALLRSADSGRNERDIYTLIGLIFAVKPDTILPSSFSNSSTNDTHNTAQSYLQISSIWLSCLCRILFLSMVPLNGWLYGIRSRSLRGTIRMFLKRYISRRQASIEINQRRRSISSVRSRDSSFVNGSFYYNNCANVCPNCQAASESSSRVFRRCSSFNGQRHETCRSISHKASIISKARNEVLQRSSSDEFVNSYPLRTVIKTKTHANNSIRFLIGDRNNSHGTAADQHPFKAPSPGVHGSPQTASLGSSLAGSNKSFMTSSTTSLLDQNGRTRRHTNESATENQQIVIARPEPNAPVECSIKDTIKIHPTDMTASEIVLRDQKDSFIRAKSFSQWNPRDLSEINHASSVANQLGGSCLDGRIESKVSANSTDCQAENEDRLSSLSTSEFRVVITAAELDQQGQQIGATATLYDEKEQLDGNSSFRTENNVGSDNETHLPVTKHQRARLSESWCKRLKQNLTKLLGSSVRLNANKLIEGEQNDWCKDASYGCSTDCREFGQDPCRIALLRRGSADDNEDQGHFPTNNFLHINQVSGEKIARNRKIRNSLTMNDIDKVKTGEFTIGIDCKCSDRQQNKVQILATSADLQSTTHLKPPNFLKLLFNPNNLAAAYSSSSALSPIKECSSNHSYASSLSSLNTTNITNANQQQSLDLSPGEVKEKPGHGAKLTLETKLVEKQRGYEFDTKLVICDEN